MRNTVLCSLLGGALLLGTASAHAVPIVYTSEAGWLAALGGASVVSEDFEASPLGDLAVGTTDIGEFSITIDSNAEGQIGISAGGVINGSREFDGDVDNDANLQLDFGDFGTLIGFAGEWYSTTTGDLLTVMINGTTINFDSYLTSGTGEGFLGFIDTDGFSMLEFGTESPSSFGEFFNLDNAQLATRGEGGAVPEPGILTLFGFGLLGLGVAARRRKMI